MKPKLILGKDFYTKRGQLRLIQQLNWENYYIDDNSGNKWVEEYPIQKCMGEVTHNYA